MSNDDNTKSGCGKYAVFLQKPFLLVDQSEFICGWGAAFINITVTYPIYKIIFRQMLHGVQASSAFHQLRREGITFLYRGIFPPLAQKTLSLALMFGVYDGTRRPLVEIGFNPYVAKIIAGVAAGTVEAALMPFERVQTLLADSTYHSLFKNTAQSFRYVWSNHGFTELYRGLTPILLRNGPSNAMFFVLREEAASRLPQYSDPMAQTAQEFMSGAIIGAVTSSIFYPFNVVKVSMQSTMGTSRISMWTAFMNVYRERGSKVANVYKGCTVNCSRAFISWGIMNTAYEHMKKLLYNFQHVR
ncbi:solute carrier family 25 member 51 isoform X1 [Bradysia coprophila]|uniref:solute carrier family 25 member 51 isoform X1 n=1 Tax=Bradysia coprophila TaxID=38358 RepID=UPI00187D9793|nr:solute carrier family 25 member 51 isoform X1 [Bradysia coprophila]XP_037039385.1 solute carrier family 25 member 51 isoform X1 [Bradysia coprophila]